MAASCNLAKVARCASSPCRSPEASSAAAPTSCSRRAKPAAVATSVAYRAGEDEGRVPVLGTCAQRAPSHSFRCRCAKWLSRRDFISHAARDFGTSNPRTKATKAKLKIRHRESSGNRSGHLISLSPGECIPEGRGRVRAWREAPLPASASRTWSPGSQLPALPPPCPHLWRSQTRGS